MTFSRKAQDNQTHLELLEINHDELDQPIRVVNNYEAITSNGEEYLPWPFTLVKPDAGADSPPRAKLVISNVHRDVIKTLRGLTSTPNISLFAVVAEVPDLVEYAIENLEVETINYDEEEIRAELVFENILVEPFPGDSYTPNLFTSIV